MFKIIIKEIKSAYKDMNKPLLICTVVLFIFGLANILTASSREAVVTLINNYLLLFVPLLLPM